MSIHVEELATILVAIWCLQNSGRDCLWRKQHRWRWCTGIIL